MVMSGENWSQSEIDASVRQYLFMLEKEKRGDEFSKAEVNRLLRTDELAARSRGSIEYRMCNISAVMEKEGKAILGGYKPRKNVGSQVEKMIVSAIHSRTQISEEVETARNVMRSIFANQTELRNLAPEYNWRGLGNLLGDYGEFICTRYYDLKQAGAGSEGFDAWNTKGRTVQIKTNRSSGTIGFRGEAELFLAIHVDDTASWDEMYYGEFEAVAKIARYSKRDNKFTVTRDKLRELSFEIAS